MRKKAHRWKPHWDHQKIDETRCVASVSSGRAGTFQCGNKRRKGSEWCAAHEPLEVKPDGGKVWGVESCFGDRPEIVSFPILKETKKQIVVDDHYSALDYKTRISKKADGSLERGYRTKQEALEAWVANREEAVAMAKERLADAESYLEQAKALLKKESS